MSEPLCNVDPDRTASEDYFHQFVFASNITYIYGALPGGGGGTCSFVPWKNDIFPCSPKSKSWFSMFPVPQYCLCSPVPFIFRLLFPRSPELNCLIPLFPKTPGGGGFLYSSPTSPWNSITLRKHAYSNILKLLPPKNENFQIKKSDIFNISAQNIDCGYSLEPPHRGGSNEYPQSMFWAEIRKIMYTLVNPSFTI